MSASAQPSPPDQLWDEAFLRVESYLLLHHLNSREFLNEIVREIIGEARADWASDPRREPIAVAMGITHARVGAWLVAAEADPGQGGGRSGAQRRLALLLADIPGKWAGNFLRREPVPAELAAALAAVDLEPGPEIAFTNMSPAPLEFGFDDSPESESPVRRGGAVFREAAGWLFLIGIYGVAWAAAH